MNLGLDLALPIIIITFIGVAGGQLPGLKMNRATIALVGAVLLVALRVISPTAALAAIDPNTLVLLFAMMIISVHLRIAGVFSWIGDFIAQHTRSARWLLAWIILPAGALSALFMNDTVVIVFTPLVLEVTRTLRRNPLPYLIGLATAANIGSTATIVGNPQNMIVGVSSHIPFVNFLGALGPVALIGLVLAWLVLVRIYAVEFRRPWSGYPTVHHGEINRPTALRSLALVGALLVAFLVGVPIPLAAMAVAASLLISRHTPPDQIFTRIDWSLLVFFTSLFVVTGALRSFPIMDQIFKLVEPVIQANIGVLALVTTLLSNLISNVPAVLLFRPMMAYLPDPGRAWLSLAMASTLAGNLTLLGSVANLIMAEIAGSEGVNVSFREYLKAGIPITAITLLVGVVWLSVVG